MSEGSRQFDIHFKQPQKCFAFSETPICCKRSLIGLLQVDTRSSFAAGY
jgi:hypothetical protein